jgi:hypothetical protein
VQFSTVTLRANVSTSRSLPFFPPPKTVMTTPARPSEVISRNVRFSVRPPEVVVMRIARVFAFGSHELSAFVLSKTFPVKCPPNQRKSLTFSPENKTTRALSPRVFGR